MKNLILKTIAFCSLALIGLTSKAQGLENVVVEEYHTVTAADAAYYNGIGNGSFQLAAGSKCYRIYIDMAPGYKLNRVYGSPGAPSPNPLDITTTTTFFNDDFFVTNQFPGQTRRIDEGLQFDSYVTVNRSGSGLVNTPPCGSSDEQVGVPRSSGEDGDGDQTTCGNYPGFTASGPNDGNIDGTAGSVQGFLVTTNFAAFTGAGSAFQMVNDAWTTFPASPGPTAANRVLIAQLTTNGNLSFHLNVELSDPNSVLEGYVWNQAGPGEVVDPRLIYPPICLPANITGITSNSPICSTEALSLNATVVGSLPISYTWTGTGTFNPNNTSEDVTVTGAATGTYNLAVSNTCGNDNENEIVTVNPATTWYADADGDGAGDPGTSQLACVQPPNYVSNNTDQCPDDGSKTTPGQCGCGTPDTDGDGDGTANCNDGCPADPNKIAPGQCGCGTPDTDGDGDGTANCNDGCPSDPNKVAPGICGCGTADTDSDGDGTANCNDGCPTDPNKIAPGICGCGVADTDSDGDGTANCNDGCPTDPNKIAPGICGCGVADTDSDGDGTANCNDGCPNDANKITPGTCGCGNPEPGTACNDGDGGTIGDVIDANCECHGTPVACTTPAQCNDSDPCTTDDCVANSCVNTPLPDGDGDGTCDATDGCPTDPNKIAPGICGCGTADTDSDGDGTANCNDGCPNDANKITPGTCGCSNLEPGTACNDGDGGTTGDVIDANCECHGTPVGCTTPAQCDDSDPCTTDDCVANSCVNTPLPDGDGDGTCDATDGCPTDPNKIAPGICGCGTPDTDSDGDGTANCNDGCPADPNKIAPGQCGCGVADTDSDGDGTANCNDGCPTDPNKIAPGICGCSFPEPGTACNDFDPNTTGDVIGSNCLCEGTPTGCTQILTLSLTLDNNGSQTTVEIRDNTGVDVLETRGPYGDGLAGTVIQEQFCLQADCYRLYVLDAAGNGITNGGYVLRDASSRRIIDAATGAFTFTSSVSLPFCVPITNQGLLAVSCDRTNLLPGTPIYCNGWPGATGYQWWWFDPHGSYSRKILLPTNQMKANQIVTNPVPLGLDLNIRVHALVGGVYIPFGRACRVRVNAPGSTMAEEGSYHDMLLNEGASAALTLHPNPNRDGVVYLNIEGLQNRTRDITIDVYDLFGARVYAEKLTVSGEVVNHVMELSSDLSQGMYLVNVSLGDHHFVQRLIKE